MLIKTSDINSIKSYLNKLYIPDKNSHKGKNGKVLIIGGSELFHAASIWAAEAASHIVDMVHYSSTQENNEIMLNLKKKFINGIVVPKENIPHYVIEDDCVLIGPGMLRGNKKTNLKNLDFKNILLITDEANYTQSLTKYLIDNFPEKRFVFDAGTLQMLDPNWLLKLKTKPILTPHSIEFENLFKIKLSSTSESKKNIVKNYAMKYNCIILLKAVDDIISDGKEDYIIEGGNSGLAKGGSGDVLASLSCSFYSKNQALLSAVAASILIKKTADKLFLSKDYWYNNSDLIKSIPEVLNDLILK